MSVDYLVLRAVLVIILSPKEHTSGVILGGKPGKLQTWLDGLTVVSLERIKHHLLLLFLLRFNLLVTLYLSSSYPLAFIHHRLEKSQNLAHNTQERCFFYLGAEDVSGVVAPISGRPCFYDHLPIHVNHRCPTTKIYHQLALPRSG